jgi:iron complex outermembrane receptor protein
MSYRLSRAHGFRRRPITLFLATAFSLAAAATQAQSSTSSGTSDAPVKSLGIVTVTGGQPTSLPTNIPTTMEGITGEQIARTINATDSEDAIKYFPSLIVAVPGMGRSLYAGVNYKF